MKKILTGIVGLDQVLYGGIPEYATVLIAGSPGTGKTILAQNILYNAVHDNCKVLYISTVAEPQIKVMRYQKQFSFFSMEAFMESVIYFDLGSIIRSQGILQSLDALEEVTKEYCPKLVVIDNLKAISDFIEDSHAFREFIYDLNVKLALWEVTVLLLGEYNEHQIQNIPEAAMVDGIIYLYGTEERKYQKRYLRILKMRGTDFAPGEHILTIDNDGIKVYPRIGSELHQIIPGEKGLRKSTGIPGLDEMLNGGLPSGTTTLVTGGTGTGKTLLGLSWLKQGIDSGEAGLLLSFDESPAQILRTGLSFGWDFEAAIQRGLMIIDHVSPVELDVELNFHRIRKMVSDSGVKRIVIDSVSTFEIGMNDEVKYTDYLWGLAEYFKASGISLLLINESCDLFNLEISRHGISYIADNIIYFYFHRKHHALSRLVGVLKMRSSSHNDEVREYLIGQDGPQALPLSPCNDSGGSRQERQ